MCVVSFHVAHPYSSIDTAIAWKKSRFILSDRLDFHMIDNQLIAVNAFASRISTSLSFDEILLLRHVKLSTNFRCTSFRVEMVPSRLKRVLCFICVLVQANASCCIARSEQQGFDLSRCICKKHNVICVCQLQQNIVCFLPFLA